jgi:uncharacterized phage protein (TIGR01671 family)
MNTDRFKFRVWDENHERYVNAFSDAYNRIWRWYIDPDGNLIGVDEENIDRQQDQNNFTIEQCTGLHDRNSKLIYEGDIVSMYIHCEDAHRKCVVEYCIDCDTAQWICRYLDGSRKHQFFGNPFDITTEYLDGSLCEIIGNIHDDQIREVMQKMEGEQCD